MIQDLEALQCPGCGGRTFDTLCLEGTEQPLKHGELGEIRFTDERYPLRVTCRDCGATVMDRAAEVRSALLDVLCVRPKREAAAAELESWIEEQGIDLEDLAAEEVLDYYSGQGSDVLNAGPFAILECLLEIYGSPEKVKSTLREGTAGTGGNEEADGEAN